ncbi:hypothetical protein EGR_10520 [Echinococcus granulosus]|uniref:Uncharacterized protein n=1 Tax=Echinococcus granulosus TaxID=6210 RepID=W6U895_ECHGR|nr:hypothetical protein EGR_10520 [Echinococcus granulosus]EUB54627.1 hypothetical protein EGR_10520 [Echinococcus granulosus]
MDRTRSQTHRIAGRVDCWLVVSAEQSATPPRCDDLAVSARFFEQCPNKLPNSTRSRIPLTVSLSRFCNADHPLKSSSKMDRTRSQTHRIAGRVDCWLVVSAEQSATPPRCDDLAVSARFFEQCPNKLPNSTRSRIPLTVSLSRFCNVYL